jgi:hypothetical protein
MVAFVAGQAAQRGGGKKEGERCEKKMRVEKVIDACV